MFRSIYIGGYFLGSRVREKATNTSDSPTSRHLSSFRASHCVHWMSISALSEVLPRIRDRSDANLGKRARIVCSVSSLWLPDLQSSQHCQEQWTGVTSSLARALNVYSKVW